MKKPSEDLLAGRRALDGIPEVTILKDWTWLEAQKSWVLNVALSPTLIPSEFVPATTEWYFVVDDRYPAGVLKVYPSKRNSVTATFQHQSLNREVPEAPWRSGDLCTATNFRQLGRQGYDYELRGPHDRLHWHVQRALEWLRAASEDKVVERGEPFELPAFANKLSGTVVFAESKTRFKLWSEIAEVCGLATLAHVKRPTDTAYVTSFQTTAGKVLLQGDWGAAVSDGMSRQGIWIRAPRVPVVPPWRFPETWRELRSVLASEGIDFDECCRLTLGPQFRDGGAHFCLLGFPIPERVGGVQEMLYWQAIDLPVLTQAHSKGGFGADPNRLWQRDKELFFSPSKPVPWANSENWDKPQIQTRGILPCELTEKRSVLVGMGAIGSVLSELLVRGGVTDLVLVDSDKLKVGNMVRHRLTMAEIGQRKASAMAERLNLLSPYARVKALNSAIEDVNEQNRSDVLDAEIVWDCTGSDEAFQSLAGIPWSSAPMCFSLSLSFAARRLFLYCERGAFSFEPFTEQLRPWLQKDLEERGDEELPREGIGCWHPVFPASATDLDLMVSIALKAATEGFDGMGGSDLLVFEQILKGKTFVGVQRVER